MPPESDLVSHTCTNCGASLQVPAAAPGQPSRITCRYCGQVFDPPAAPAQQRVVVIAPGFRDIANASADAAKVAAVTAAARSAASLVRTIISFAILFVVLGLATGVGVCVNAAKQAARAGAVSGITSALSGLPAMPNMPSKYMWDTVAGPPIPAAVGGHGEGFVGRVRERGDDQLFVAAFEGSKLGEVWKVGPLGTYSQAYQSTFASVAGSHVVVTDYKANVHVYDLGTGHETHTIKLSDRAKAMCVAPDTKAHVWIEVADKRDVLVDADAGTSTPTARPAWCPDLWAASDDCRGWLKRGAPRAGCLGAESAPKMTAFKAVNVVEQGDLAVALGKKHPGTALPAAVGFDPRTKTVRWEQPIVSGDQSNGAELSTTAIMDALEGGRFVTPYELSPKGWHFTAFDARSGQRLWDIELQSALGVDNPEGFSLSADRLYVMRTSAVEVYDAKSGILIGSVGN
jgi:outer membrane protein assembly factor BamB